jgi:hypothetical protein
MHPSVKSSFMWFTDKFEGGQTAKIDYMFLDSLGRVGTAYGLDLDMNASGRSLNPAISRSEGLPKALAMSWTVLSTGLPASAAEVTSEWDFIKALATPRVYYWYKQYTKLQLTRASMTNRVFQLLAANEATLKRNADFKDFDLWPADAQLAVLGLSWNGVGHLVGNTHGTLKDPAAFRAACKLQDFNLAATLCEMVSAPTNVSIANRSAAQKDLLLNAATVVKEESLGYYQRPTLYWPMILV